MRITRVHCWTLKLLSSPLSMSKPPHLDHDVILVDDAIVGEAAQGGDALVGHIKLRCGLVGILALLAQLVDLPQSAHGAIKMQAGNISDHL